ncbi:putative G-protein coupled receptor 160 isoform 1-T8 [Menidia menidia]
MYVSIIRILISLGGKCLLNWALVFLQRTHVCGSFLAAFAVSVAVVDAALTLAVTIIHHSDGSLVLLGHLLTSYHICLLLQIVGQIHRVLQWPVVAAAAVDHFCAATRRLHATTVRTKRAVFLVGTFLLWGFAALHTFLLSDFKPVLEDVSYHHIHRCWVAPCTQVLHISLILLLALGYSALHAGRFGRLSSSPNNQPKAQTVDQIEVHCRSSFVQRVLSIFLHTWSPFLVFLAVLLLLPEEIPSHLALSVPWLCFLNSLLVALVLCAVCPVLQLSPGSAAPLPDSFCVWKF